jgi:hypothetical protein
MIRLFRNGLAVLRILFFQAIRILKMTQRYAHHCPDSLRDGVEILETGAIVDYTLTAFAEKRG